MSEPAQLDDIGRWWRVDGREVDLNAAPGAYLANVRACALAHRDAVDDEGRNVAALLAAQVEARDATPLPVVSGWLFARAQQLATRLHDHLEGSVQRVHAA